MEGKITKLTIQRVKGEPGETVTEMLLVEDVGIEGNAIQGGDRQVCIFSSEARSWMSGQTQPGLCFKRFQENILTENFALEETQTGDNLCIGNAVLRITEKKFCFPECVNVIEKRPCRLSASGRLAAVTKGAVIKTGDTVDKAEQE